jgi:hypothetical protein
MFEGEPGMRIRAKLLHDIRVTSGARILADEIGRIRCRLWLGSYRLLLASEPGSREPGQ